MNLKVAIANPYCWPEVRRGAERFIHDLARYLRRSGHEVTVVSTASDRRKKETGDGIRRLIYPSMGRALSHGLFPLSLYLYLLQCLHALLKNQFDIIHCMTHYDAFAAGFCKRFKRIKTVFHVIGIPMRSYFRSVFHEYLLFRSSLRRADSILVISEVALDYLTRDFQLMGELLPIPVDLGFFKPTHRTESASPKILMAGDLNVTRKGARSLAKAFPRVKQVHPNAKLQLSGQIGDQRRCEVMSLIPIALHKDVEILGVGELEEMPGLYREASVTVLPAMWEAFGMVLLESLACGTPVVGARHGGIPDIITSPEVGVLFEPGPLKEEVGNVEGLVQAILHALELSKNPDTARICRSHAEQYGWNAIGPRYEALYERTYKKKA